MVAPVAFPLAKLGFLLIKQVAKPVAKSIAASAKQSRVFRDYVCVPVAQLFHFYEVKMKMRALNLGGGKVTKVPKLSEVKAVEKGAELLSEVIIVSIASGILIYEYNKSREKDEAKEERLKADRETIKNKIFDLELKVEKQSTQIRRLATTAIHLEEEIQKRSLKGFIHGPSVPEELIETVKDIPEVPAEVKPLQLSEDISPDESNISKENKSEEEEKPTVPIRTPIQDLVEKHYARPSLIENKVEVVATTDDDDIPPNQGIVTDSVSYVLQKGDQNKSNLIINSTEEEGIVTGGLSQIFKQWTGRS